MFLLLIVLLMRLLKMSVNKKSDLKFDAKTVDDVKENLHEDKFSILNGTRFLKGLFTGRNFAKLPLAQIFFNDNKAAANNLDYALQRLLVKFVGRGECGGGGRRQSTDWESDLKSSFMGVSDEFINSGFQWSQDYGSFNNSRENIFGSSMTASYDDMAKNLDAHLAELDIESFRAADINSLLKLKSMELGEEITEESYPDLLFSTMGVNQYLSVDSLNNGDLDNGPEDLMDSIANNCRANKENYTITFENSIVGSTDSQESKSSSQGEVFKKTSWNQMGSSSTTQSLDPEGSFIGKWNTKSDPSVHQPREEDSHNAEFKLNSSPRQGSMNLVKIFMKQRTSSSSSIEVVPGSDLKPSSQPNITALSKDCNRVRKKSMNDSGKCSTLSHHAEEQEDFQLDSLDVNVNISNTNTHQPVALKKQKSVEIQTSKHFDKKSKLFLFPSYKLPNLDFVHLENDVMTSQFGDDLEIFSCHQRPDRFRHILDWDSLLFLLSKEHKEKLKKYPELNGKIIETDDSNDFDVFTDCNLRVSGESCDCESILSGRTSASSNTSATRYSSDSGLGPNTYNFDDFKKLFVYDYTVEDEPVEIRKLQRRATMTADQFAHRKRVSFEQQLPKKSSNKSTSSIPKLIAAKSNPKPHQAKDRPCSSKIPKLIKSPSKSNVPSPAKRPVSLPARPVWK